MSENSTGSLPLARLSQEITCSQATSSSPAAKAENRPKRPGGAQHSSLPSFAPWLEMPVLMRSKLLKSRLALGA